MAGKGDKARNNFSEKFRKNWNEIKWKKNETQLKKKNK